MIADISIVKNGFCDRLKLLTFYIAVADRKGDRRLFIKEERSMAGPFLFMEVCEIRGFEVQEWTPAVKDVSLDDIDYGFEPNIRPSLKFVKRNKPKDLAVSDDEFLKLWVSCYQKVRPLPHIREKIAALKLGDDCLGLHIRMTDKLFPDILDSITPNALTTNQVPKINRIIAKRIQAYMASHAYGSRKIYLAADSQEWYGIWSKKINDMGYSVISNDPHYDHTSFRQTSGEDFIIDLFSLAECRSVIGTVNSGVPMCAAYINGSAGYYFAFREMSLTRYTNYIHWHLRYRYHMSLFDLHHSIIVRYMLKPAFMKGLVRKVRQSKPVRI